MKIKILLTIISCLCLLCSCDYANKDSQYDSEELLEEKNALEEEFANLEGKCEDLTNIIIDFEKTLKHTDFLKGKQIKNITFNKQWNPTDSFKLTFTSYDEVEHFLFYELDCEYEYTSLIKDLNILVLVETSQGNIHYLDNCFFEGEDCLWLDDFAGENINIYIFATAKDKQYVAKFNLDC